MKIFRSWPNNNNGMGLMSSPMSLDATTAWILIVMQIADTEMDNKKNSVLLWILLETALSAQEDAITLHM